MKRIILLFKFFFLSSLFSYSQDYIEVSSEYWNFITDTSAFDGVTRAAFIIGTSNNSYVTTPILAVNKTDDEETLVILTYYPADISGNSRVMMKFSGDPKIYTFNVSYNIRLERYIVIFDDKELSQYLFINKLRSNIQLWVRLVSRYTLVDVKYSLSGANEALMKLYQ